MGHYSNQLSNLLVISIDRPISYLKSISLKSEDDVFYEAVVQNITDTVLEYNDNRGEDADGFSIAWEMLTNHYSDKVYARRVCNHILDMVLRLITEHLPDLSSPQFSGPESLSHTMIGDRLEITIHHDAQENASIFNR